MFERSPERNAIDAMIYLVSEGGYKGSIKKSKGWADTSERRGGRNWHGQTVGLLSDVARMSEITTQLSIPQRQVPDALGEIGRLDQTADLDGALLINQLPDKIDEVGRELGVPAILPCNQTDQRINCGRGSVGYGPSATVAVCISRFDNWRRCVTVDIELGAQPRIGVVAMVIDNMLTIDIVEDGLHGSRREPGGQTGLVGFHGVVMLVQPGRKVPQKLPACGRSAVLHQKLVIWLLPSARDLSAPCGINLEIFVENHEEIVKPPLTKTFILES